MEFVTIFRVLAERRVLVALGIVVAIAAGWLTSREQGSGRLSDTSTVGSVRMVLDTSDSQLIQAAPEGADTLAMRAALLANALGTDAGMRAIARSAGIASDDLVVVGPAAKRTPTLETPLVSQVAEATSNVQARYLVDVSADDLTPLISIKAHGPDAAGTAQLTEGAVAGLRSLLVEDDGTKSHGFVLDTAAPVRVEEESRTSHDAVLMLGTAFMAFTVWCACMVLIVGFARRIRPAHSTLHA